MKIKYMELEEYKAFHDELKGNICVQFPLASIDPMMTKEERSGKLLIHNCLILYYIMMKMVRL